MMNKDLEINELKNKVAALESKLDTVSGLLGRMKDLDDLSVIALPGSEERLIMKALVSYYVEQISIGLKSGCSFDVSFYPEETTYLEVYNRLSGLRSKLFETC